MMISTRCAFSLFVDFITSGKFQRCNRNVLLISKVSKCYFEYIVSVEFRSTLEFRSKPPFQYGTMQHHYQGCTFGAEVSAVPNATLTRLLRSTHAAVEVGVCTRVHCAVCHLRTSPGHPGIGHMLTFRPIVKSQLL